MEKWDAYNERGKIEAGELLRDNPIPKGLYHLVSEVLLRHMDGDYLIMQRDFNKHAWGGYFEATAGGSALKGETAMEAASRELFEETGIHGTRFSEIGRLVTDDAIFVSFIATCDSAKDSVILQKGETISYKWITKEELIIFLNSDECIPSQRERILEHIVSE